MKIIKFRAWNENEMHEDGETKFWLSQGFFEDFPEEFKIMQFTGLKDKNGKEIYEGDILKVIFEKANQYPHLNIIKAVEWGSYSDGEYVSNIECWMAGDEPVSDKGGMYGSSVHDYEIIGNIYENPELLNNPQTSEA